ncbi:MAG: two-component regulator propeller domain-containing protein [Rikenellaceae bacterium]
MKQRAFIVTILFAILPTFSTYSQSSSLPKEVGSLTLSDGLPHNAVSALLLDSRGYLWIGTYDGLARYNSHTITGIEFDDEEYALIGRRVRSLMEDTQGAIWLGSDAGILKIDQTTDRTQRLPIHRFDNVNSNFFAITNLINVESQGVIYAIAERFGALVYDINGTLTQVIEIPRDSGIVISDSQIDSAERVLLTTNKGLFIYDPTISDNFTKVQGIEANTLQTLLCYDNRLLIATPQGIYDGEIGLNNTKNRYRFTHSTPPLLPQERAHTMMLDKSGSLWVGTRQKGMLYIPNYCGGNRNTSSLCSGERSSKLLAQGDDEMWYATFDNGVYRYTKANELFTNINSDEGLNRTGMAKFTTVEPSYLLINTIYRQSYLYDLEKGNILATPPYIAEINKNTNRWSVKSPDGTIWILTDKPYWLRVDPAGNYTKIKNEVTIETAKSTPISSCVDREGNIWCGYADDLCRITIDDNGTPSSVESLRNNRQFAKRGVPRIRVIYADPTEDVVWIGTTTDGLFKIATKGALQGSTVEIYNHRQYDKSSLTSNFVSSILRDSRGTLWVGTEHGGVCKMVNDYENGIEVLFECVDKSGGLSNNVVKSLIEDRDHNLWISTNYGLNRLNLDDQTIFTYHEEDGLPFEQFWYGSQMTSSGELLFSGVGGILQFDPKKLSKESELPRLEFSDLKLLNSTVKPRKSVNGRVILDRSLTDQTSIDLKHDENMIQVGVDVIHPSSLNTSQIRYQLLPVSHEWLSVPSSLGVITLNGLEAGEYQLNVVAIDALGRQLSPKTLYINIAPHPLRSTLAIVIYIIITLTIVGAILASLLHVSKLKLNLTLEREKKRNAERLNEEKQRYFVNISHELKTPLTLILAPANALAQRFKFDVDITSKVDVIRRQSNRMLQLIDSTHKLNLDELNILQPQIEEFDFDNFMAELIEDFKFLAEQEGKELAISSSPAYVKADKTLLEMAICNILNNAFKYTKAEDKISVSYQTTDNSIVMRVTDSGAGISEEDLPRIFERFFRGTDAMKKRLGTGVGLSFTKRLIELHNGTIEAHSTLGVGASFTITLPILTEEQSHKTTPPTQAEKMRTENSIILDLESDTAPNVGEEIRGSMAYVVEDNSQMRNMIVEALEPYFRVRSFESGEACLEQMATSWPQIIISDVMMDQMSGYDLCRSVKETLATSHIPVILLTGLSSVDDKIRGLESGADAYIYKPFYVNHLLTRVEHLLRGREELRKRFEAGIPVEYGESRAMSQLDNEFIDKLYSLFEENLDNEQIDMDYIASELLLSRSALYQKIKALVGNTPYELLKNYRLTRAADMLQQGDGTNVNEVCYSTGFKNRAHFSRVFKERFGVSPSKYTQKRE